VSLPDLPISSRAPANLPTYCRMNRVNADSGMPSSRIGSEWRNTFASVMMPRVSMPISVTIGLPE
jgi:hypothetical protein